MADLSRSQRASAACAAAALVCAPLTAGFEGLRLRPYLDPARIWTVCYGETERELRVYSKGECGQLLRQRLSRDYAPQLLQCVPALVDNGHRNQFAALLDASYNGGAGGACRSAMARSFNAGAWRQGCEAFRGWRVTAKGQVLRGLVRRREAERALCLSGLVQ